MVLLGKWPTFDLRENLRPLPLILLNKRLLLLQRARSNMMPFSFALEANNVGRMLDLFLALLLDVIGLLAFGLVLLIGVESKSTLVIGRFLHTQHLLQ